MGFPAFDVGINGMGTNAKSRSDGFNFKAPVAEQDHLAAIPKIGLYHICSPLPNSIFLVQLTLYKGLLRLMPKKVNGRASTPGVAQLYAT